MISAHELARSTDVSSSHVVARRVVKEAAARELLAVRYALSLHDGSTSAELAERTPHIGFESLGQSPDEWRSTCARRLPNGEDRGMFRAVCPSKSKSRPWREVDTNIRPCAVSDVRSIRWYLREE